MVVVEGLHGKDPESAFKSASSNQGTEWSNTSG